MLPIDLATMLDGLARSRRAAASKDWRHQDLRELAFAINAFSDLAFLDRERAFADPEPALGGWFSVLPFLGGRSEPDLADLTRTKVVHCAMLIHRDSAAPFADVPPEDEPRLDEAARRLRAFWRAGPSVLQQALISIADDILQRGRGLSA